MCDKTMKKGWIRPSRLLMPLLVGMVCFLAVEAEVWADELAMGATAGEELDQTGIEVTGSEEPAVGEVPEEAGRGIDGPRIGRGLRAPSSADPAFEEELGRYREAFERYAATVVEYERTIENLIQTEFDRRMAQINSRYDPPIRAARSQEDQRRIEAIESLESFLGQYPRDPENTPDALFRLAILYDQREDAEYGDANREYFEAMNQFDDPELWPDPPQRSYENSQEMFTRLITDWPDYRGIDLAYYFMAHIEWEQGNGDKARDMAAELIRRTPESEFVPHAWLMIGEFHFEDAEADGEDRIRENLLLALDAFRRAGGEDGRNSLTDANYIRAVYSWAWSEYRLENYPGAIEIFKKVIEVVDESAERTGQRRDALRDDSIGHLAEILAIEDWDLDGEFNPDDTVMARIREHLSDGAGYEREVLIRLAEELFRFLRYEETIEVYEYVLAADPLHPENPSIHAQVVVALHRDFREEEAFAVRRQMMDFYGHESAWYQHQRRRGNEAALRRADNLVRDYLLMAATWYHEQAQTTRNEALVRRDPALVAVAEERYAIAADAYREFLAQFPNDGEIYQWNFYYAETLYYSAQYEEAFEQYQVVREMDLPDNPFQEVSAFNAITALEYVMRDRVQAGELTPRALAGLNLEASREDAEQLSTPREFDDERALQAVTVEGEPIPPLVIRYVTAMDRYVVLQLENEQDRYLGAKFAFQAASVFYDFRHNEEARTRYAWIVENYPEHEVAYLAGSRILETFRQENNYAALAEWAERLGDIIQGDQADAIRAEVREYRLIAMFRASEESFGDENYENAAEEFMRLYREAPDHRLAARALNNAAVAFESMGRYGDASDAYEELFREFPDDEFAPRAVFRVAVNAEWLFDYDKAIRHYQLFYDQYRGPTPETLAGMGFDIEQSRQEALLNVAQFKEYLQRYSEAAQGYESFYQAYPEHEFAPVVLWAAAEAWEKAGNEQSMIRIVRDFIQRYENTVEHAERAMQGRKKLARRYDDRGETRNRNREYDAILAAFTTWQEAEEEPERFNSMRAMAAETRFMQVEEDFARWDDIRIRGNLAQQQRLLGQKIDGIDDLVKNYQTVLEYRNLDWNLAVYFRLGNILHRFAEELYEVPVPFPEGSDEYWEYRDVLDEIAFPLEDAAIERYEEAFTRARDNEIVNQWTRRTLEELHSFQPANYRLYREERRPRSMEMQGGMPMLSHRAFQRLQEREDWQDLEPETAGGGAQ